MAGRMNDPASTVPFLYRYPYGPRRGKQYVRIFEILPVGAERLITAEWADKTTTQVMVTITSRRHPSPRLPPPSNRTGHSTALVIDWLEDD